MKEKCCKYKNNLKDNKIFSSITFRLKFQFCDLLLLLLYIFVLSDNSVLLVDSQSIGSQFDGGLINGRKVLSLKESPFYIKNDIIVEDKSELLIEPGVTINFNHRVGITVKGTIIANVSYFRLFFLTFLSLHFSQYVPNRLTTYR